MLFEPREYQQEAIDYGLADKETPILASPTGSGKTLIALFMAKQYLDRGKKVAILTPREEILNQFVERADFVVGPSRTGVVRSGYPLSPYAELQICSWPTLRSRAVREIKEKKRDGSLVLPDADLCIVDEAHLSATGQMINYVLPYYQKNSKIVGLTATPAAKNGYGLGSVYTSIKHVISIRRLIDMDFLCPLEYFAGKKVDLTDVRMRSGDYVAKDLGKSVTKLVGDYVDNWLRIARDRRTIVFTPDQASCEGVTERYNQAGIKALSLHSAKHHERRAAIVKAFKEGKAQVLVNVGIASYGFDCPEVECIQLLRNTKSIVLHLQQLGRGMRIHEGKTECLVLDHTSNTYDLGYADDLFRWKLTTGKQSVLNWSRDERSGETKEGEDPKPHECINCGNLFSRRLDCPKCGAEIKIKARDLEVSDAKLVRISRKRAKELNDQEIPTGRTLYRQLLHIQERRDYSPKWPAVMYKKLHPRGFWPSRDWNEDEAEPPCHELLNWVNRQITAARIRYAKRKTA